MSISLPPQLEQLIHDRVKSGLYGSASEVIREALRLLEAQDREADLRMKRLKSDIEEGVAQLHKGRASPFDAAAVERIKKAGRAKLKGSKI